MSLETEVYSALKSLVGNRVSPVIFPQPPSVPEWPAIRYTIVSSIPFNELQGDPDEDTSEARVQLDVVAVTFKAVRALRVQVIAAMAGLNPPWLPENDGSSEYDSDTKTYREILEYSRHASSDSGNSPP